MQWIERFGGRTFAYAAFANFLHSMGFHTYLHLPGYLEGLGADPFQMGLVIAIAHIVAIAVRPTVGRWVDNRGRRPVALGGGVLALISALAYLQIDRLGPALYALRVLHGVALGALFSVLFTIAADVVPAQRRAQGIAIFGISGMLPLALGGLMGDLLLSGAGPSPGPEAYARIFMAISTCAGLGLLASFPIPETRDPKVRPTRTYAAAASAPELRSVWFIGLAFAFALAAFFVFLKTYTIERGLSSLGEAFSWYAGVAIALRIFFGGLPERVGMKRVLFPALAASAAGLLLLSLAGSAWEVDLAAALCGAGHGFAFPIISALVVERARPEERGSAVSLFTALFDFGVLAGGPTLGWVVKNWSYGPMFAIAAAICAVASVIFWFWDREAPPAAAAARG